MTNQKTTSELESQVCNIIGMESEKLFWIRMEFGCDFLRYWIGEDLPEECKEMELVPEYWSWWMQTWEMIDKRFVSRFKGRKADIKTYMAIHNPKGLALYPNRVILESYHKLMKELANQHLTEQTT